ncbi:MAG: response regulator transcription factor [Vulcanimicrobiota bacterium]
MPNFSQVPPHASGRLGKLLLIEDNPELSRLLEAYLSKQGFELEAVDEGDGVLEQLKQGYDLILLDLLLPGISGMEVIKRVRARTPLPILVISACAAGEDRVKALDLGADDYLVKPFLPAELVARVRALLRRTRTVQPSAYESVLEIDPASREVRLLGQPVDLTERERELLMVLASEPGRNFTRAELLERIWGGTQDTRRVDLYISRIRAKLRLPGDQEFVHSIYGVGYRFGQ